MDEICSEPLLCLTVDQKLLLPHFYFSNMSLSIKYLSIQYLMLIFTQEMGQNPIFSMYLLTEDQIAVKEYTRYLV